MNRLKSFIYAIFLFMTPVVWGDLNNAEMREQWGLPGEGNDDTDVIDEGDDDLSAEEKAAKEISDANQARITAGESAAGDTEIEIVKEDGGITSYKVGDKTFTAEEMDDAMTASTSDSIELNGKTFKKADVEKLVADLAAKADKNDDIEGNITIGKKEFTPAEFAEMLERAAKHYDMTVEELEATPQNILTKNLAAFLNLEEGSKALNEKNQSRAEKEKILSGREQDFEKLNLEQKKKAKKLDDREEELKAREKELKELIKEDPDDEINEVKRTKLIVKQAQAENELEGIKHELNDDIKNARTEIEANTRAIYIQSQIEELVEAFPELKTADDVDKIITEYQKNGDYSGKAEDLAKANLIIKVLNDYLIESKGTKIKVSTYFKTNRDFYPKVAAAQPEQHKGKSGMTDIKNQSVKNIFTNLLKKQKEHPHNPAGAGKTSDSTVSKTKKDSAKYMKDTGWGKS